MKSELQKREQDYLELKEMKDQLQIEYEKTCTKYDDLMVDAKRLIKDAKKVPEEHEEKLNQLKRRLNSKEEEVKQLQSEKQSALSRLVIC